MKICQCHDCSIVIKTVSDDYICDFNMIFYMKFSSYVLVDCEKNEFENTEVSNVIHFISTPDIIFATESPWDNDAP